MKRLIFLAFFAYYHWSHAKLNWASQEFPREVANQRDPFENIEKIELDNGLTIYFAPSKDSPHTSIRVQVGVGWDIEEAGNYGAAHLLEHVLFRDKQLKDEMSYLQIIRENGGEANGQTESRTTSYFGTISSEKGPWLLDQFTKMLLNPSINAEYVSKEKSTVELERGRPSPIVEALGFDFKDLYPQYLRTKSFWQTEFNVSFDPKYTLAQEQLSTRKLTVEQLNYIYENYYYPANMKVFIGGRYNKAEIMARLQPWLKMPKRDGKKMPPLLEADPRKKPFMFSTVTHNSPYLYIGTKIWDVTLEEFYVLDSYVEYVAHRLMKEVRNKKGQTYSAQAKTYTYNRYGYSYINFETTRENFKENLQLARDFIEREAREGALTEEQMFAAISLYLNRYGQIGQDSRDMVWLSQFVSDTREEFDGFSSPHKIMSEMNPTKYNSILKKYYSPERHYRYIYQPPILFHYDLYLLQIFVYLLCFLAAQKILSKDFKHSEIRWIRKIKYPPFKLLEASALLLACAFFWHIYYLLNRLVLSSPFLQSNILYSEYLFDVVQIMVFVGCIQLFLSNLPKKLMVVGNNLYIKSVSYYSKKISLNDIERVETISAMSFPFPLSSWLIAVGPRFFFVNPLFWQKGLLIQLKNGKAYFFSMASAHEAKRELARLLPVPPDDDAKFPLDRVA